MTIARAFAFTFVAALTAPIAASAQPGVEPPPAAPAEPPPQPMDEAKIREIVDREMARVLNERAAAEAAERAEQERAAQDAPAAAGPSDLTGASGFMDTRIAFTLTNENMLVKPGETIPSVPGWRFGVPNSLGVLFFDNYDTRFSGFETLTHAVAYRNYHKGHFDAEGALVIRINEISERTIELSDAGTYITLSTPLARCESVAVPRSLPVGTANSSKQMMRVRLARLSATSSSGSAWCRNVRSSSWTPAMKR
jgi:hypothetical protein